MSRHRKTVGGTISFVYQDIHQAETGTREHLSFSNQSSPTETENC